MRALLLCLGLLLLIYDGAFGDGTEQQLKDFLQSRKVIDRVYFDNGSGHLSENSQRKLDELAPRLRDYVTQGYLLRVEGFASPEGSVAGNVSLSMQRSVTVRNYLRDGHHLSIDLFLTGFGGVEDVDADNARRVDIAMYKQPEAALALFDDNGTIESIVLK